MRSGAPLGLSGRLTQATIRSKLTPLFLLAALAAGLIALFAIPREEEPQISVPMVDILVNADGLRAADAAELVTKPLEIIVKAIKDVEHVYSQTQDDRVMVTARFRVGTSQDSAVLRVHDRIRANLDRIPPGIAEPLVVGRGIDDVAIVTLTLSPRPDAAARWSDQDLQHLAMKLQTELAKVEDVGLSTIVGAGLDEIRVEPDPEKLSLFGVTLQQLVAKVRDANRSFVAGHVRDAGGISTVTAGQTLQGVPDIGLLLLATRDGRPVYVRDVARVMVGPGSDEARVWSIARGPDGPVRAPAATLALAKRAGANAVVVSQAIVDRLANLRGRLLPDDITVEVTRNYGSSASDKANELLFHLGLATLSIVALIGLAIGWREAAVTLVVIPTTILLTMLAAQMMGYTINRVSLFALIFSIGILVDDAIVVVENIARHWGMRRRPQPHAGGNRGGRRGRQPDGDCDPDRGRGAAADAVRVGADGAVHGADSGRRFRRHAVFVRRRDGDRAVADAEAGAAWRRWRRASWRGTARASVSPGCVAGAGEPDAGVDFPAGRGLRHAGRLRAVLYPGRHRQAAAVRQQVRACRWC